MHRYSRSISEKRDESKKRTDKKIQFVRRSLIKWWSSDKQREKNFPWRSKRTSKYKALITEILLQRTKADAVEKVYYSFFNRFPTKQHLAKTTKEDIQKEINSLGLAWRAQKLKELAVKLDGHRIPESIEQLVNLPGVGQYAAGAFLSLHREKRAIIPDANMVRILGRVFGFRTTPETRRKRNFLFLCETITPRKKFREFNYAILDLGRELCTPYNPKCTICPIRQICKYALRLKRQKKDHAPF